MATTTAGQETTNELCISCKFQNIEGILNLLPSSPESAPELPFDINEPFENELGYPWTPFQCACITNWTHVIERLAPLLSEDQINLRTYYGNAISTCLPSHKGELGILKQLCQPQVDLNIPNEKGMTLLHSLIQRRDWDACLFLLPQLREDELNTRDARGKTPGQILKQRKTRTPKPILRMFAMYGAQDTGCAIEKAEHAENVFFAIEHDLKRVLEGIEHCFSATLLFEENAGDSSLRVAVRHKRWDIVTFLMDCGGNPAELAQWLQDDYYDLAIHQALRGGWTGAVEELLERGVNVEMPDDDGWYPIHHAIAKGLDKIVRSLVSKYDANPNLQTQDGTTTLQLALTCSNKHHMVKTLIMRCKCQFWDLSPSVEFWSDRNEENFIAHIVKENDKRFLAKLMKHLDNVNELVVLANPDGEGLLHQAVRYRSHGVLQFLLDQQKVPPLHARRNGDTALHMAVRLHNIQAIRILRHHIDPSVQNNHHETPMSLAQEALGGAGGDALVDALLRRDNFRMNPVLSAGEDSNNPRDRRPSVLQDEAWSPIQDREDMKAHTELVEEFETYFREKFSRGSQTDVKRLSLLEDLKTKLGAVVDFIDHCADEEKIDLDPDNKTRTSLNTIIEKNDFQINGLKTRLRFTVGAWDDFESLIEDKDEFLFEFETESKNRNIDQLLRKMDEIFASEVEECVNDPAYFRKLTRFHEDSRENLRFRGMGKMYEGVGTLIQTGKDYPGREWEYCVNRLEEIGKRIQSEKLEYEMDHFPAGGKLRQPQGKSILEMFALNLLAQERLNFEVNKLANIMASEGIRTQVYNKAGVKSLYRTKEKMAFSTKYKNKNDFNIWDLSRAMISCDTLSDIIKGVRILRDTKYFPGVKVVNFLNRFTIKPNDRWKDIMIHVVFMNDMWCEPVERIICEIQFSLVKMTMTRKELGGHDAYSKFRAALEIQSFVKEELRHRTAGEPGRDAHHRSQSTSMFSNTEELTAHIFRATSVE